MTNFRTPEILEPSIDMAGVQPPSVSANYDDEGQPRTPARAAVDTVDSSKEMSLSLSRG